MTLALLSIAYIAIMVSGVGEKDDSIINNAFVNPNSKNKYEGY